MRMTKQDREVKSYSVTRAPNGEGIMSPTITLVDTFSADLQPAMKSASRRAEFGFDSTQANLKALFYDVANVLTEGMIVEDQTDLERYMVVGPPNLWQSHSEAVMVAWNGV